MRIPILIVGAGPAGLTSSILLSRLGVRSLTVERHAATSTHPKATGISTRTMELFRHWRIEARVRTNEIRAVFSSSHRPTLSGPELETRSLGYPTREDAAVFSPTWPAVLAQDALEPILLDYARSFDEAEVRFATELVDLEQTPGGVRASLVDHKSGERYVVHARYLLAADGANSPIRRRLGIGVSGVECIGQYLSILFRADIDAIVGPNRHGLYMLHGVGGPAPTVVVPTSNDNRWLIATPWRGDARPAPTLSSADLVAIVRQAAGCSDLAVDLIDHQLVEIGAGVAERFRQGSVFLVGDAAHRTAPTGGTGMNTAIHAAHNLAWKLAAVLRGTAGDALLDTYEPERRPSGERNVLRSLGKLQGVSGVASDLGVVYASHAVIADGEPERPAVIEPTGPACVGARLPHLSIECETAFCSTLDLVGEGLVLITGDAGRPAWSDAVRAVSNGLGLPLGVVTVSPASDAVARWFDAVGIESEGAVLVRPDGHIAWRSVSAAAEPVATLERVLSRVLCTDVGTRRASGWWPADDRRCA